MLFENVPLTGQQGLYGSAVLDKNTKEVILKVVNSIANAQASNVELKGVGKINPTAKVTVLKSESLEGVNSLDNPMAISPAEESISIKGKRLSLALPPNSFSVVRIKMN